MNKDNPPVMLEKQRALSIIMETATMRTRSGLMIKYLVQILLIFLAMVKFNSILFYVLFTIPAMMIVDHVHDKLMRPRLDELHELMRKVLTS